MPRRRRAVAAGRAAPAAAGRDRADAGGSRPDDGLDEEEYGHRGAGTDRAEEDGEYPDGEYPDGEYPDGEYADDEDEYAEDADDEDAEDGDDEDGDGYEDGDGDAGGAAGGEDGARRARAVPAIRAAMRLVTQLTGRPAEGVVSMAPADGGGWTVGVEVVETRRIPDSADILAVYEATVDGDLELAGFRRTRRYSRGQVDAR